MFIGLLSAIVISICIASMKASGSRSVRQTILLISSYGLYVLVAGWLVVILLISVLANHFFGRWVRKTESSKAVALAVVANVALLASFKYLPEVSLALSLPSLAKFSHIALPLGISFWTFQALSYVFDQYRGEDLDPTLTEFALYMAFFPIVISGPICRLPDMLQQFRSVNKTQWEQIGAGLARCATGVLMMQFSKLLGQGVLAGDGIASGFDHVTRWGGLDVWALAFGFGLQLFFDFAGYSHIAIGIAQCLGFLVPENFHFPFDSTTPSVFWTRWHMSLSFWIRDYLFLPMATLRREMWWRNFALVFSMVLFGLWHKATALFILWGCYHGLLLLLHRQVQQLQRRFNWQPQQRTWTAFSWITTMCLINLGWIFFRANSLSQATQMLTAVVSPGTYGSRSLTTSFFGLVGSMAAGYAIARISITILDRHAAVDVASRPASRARTLHFISRNRWYWLAPLYVLLLIAVLLITFSQSGGGSQLMYRGF